jgi:hypothetical protein
MGGIVDGPFLRPQQRGAGMKPTPEAIQRYTQPLS